MLFNCICRNIVLFDCICWNIVLPDCIYRKIVFFDWIWRNTKLLNCNCRNIVLLDCFWEIMCSLIAFVAILFSLLARSRPDPDVRQGDKMKKKWLFFSLWNCGQDPEWILFHFSLAWVIYRKDCKGYYHVSDLESLFRRIWLLFPMFDIWWKNKYVYGGKGRACFQLLDLNLLKCSSVAWKAYFARNSTCTWSVLAYLSTEKHICWLVRIFVLVQ